MSIFNFHYATPPDTVGMNYGLNRVLADNETGFRGSQDLVYRSEAWEFILAGGAIYDNLDYSFSVGHEDGLARPDAPGGGGAALRRQLAILKQFIEGFDFVRMKPDLAVISGRRFPWQTPCLERTRPAICPIRPRRWREETPRRSARRHVSPAMDRHTKRPVGQAGNIPALWRSADDGSSRVSRGYWLGDSLLVFSGAVSSSSFSNKSRSSSQ